MNLRTEEAFWLLKNGYSNVFNSIEKDLTTEIAIIGGGITGALTAYALAEAGFEVTVFDKRHPGLGSTAASTALLQYEIDEPLHRLMEMTDRKRAQDSYISCIKALDSIAGIVEKEKIAADFRLQPSLQYASYKKDVSMLKKELRARREIGIDVRYLEPDEIRTDYFLKAPGGLLSAKSGQMDPYAFVQGIFSRKRGNLRIMDNVEITALESNRSYVRLITGKKFNLKARKVIVACGYESQKFLPFSVANLGATYALVTKPVAPDLLWRHKALLWETKNPYIYIRTTEDNRLLLGGRDDEHHNTLRRNKSLYRKTNELLMDMKKLMPHLPLSLDFCWAGTFASTRDALGYIGGIRQLPNVYFILGYGGNGILYSQTGAEIICSALCGRKHPYSATFSFDRQGTLTK